MRAQRGYCGVVLMRYLSIFLGICGIGLFGAGGGCAGAVTQDPPDDPSSMSDAGDMADAGSMEDAGNAGDASSDAGVVNAVIGSPCTLDADCGTGYRCQPTVPGGYCVADCSPNQACPEGSVCSPLPMSRVTGVCMRPCSSVNDCRKDYVCEVVYLFPGDPNAPSSQVPVCWVAPP